MESQSVTVAADLSAKVILLCAKYFVNVAHARAEVERLKEQLKSLETTLRQAKHLLEHPSSQFLSASRELDDPIQKCQAELQRLRDKLEPNTKDKAMRKFGLRAVKWPFSKGEVEAITVSLVEYREAITAILQIDQT
jgi:DNA repair exonuclease SbcCD ATPase subunit